MKKNGTSYDYVVTPFYGGAELGFALNALLDIKGMQKPKILPVRFSGNKARIHERQRKIFTYGTKDSLVEKSLLILDDNSGTGTTLRELKEELGRYAPSQIDTSVVQAGVRRVTNVIAGEKSSYQRAAIVPEDLDIKAISEYDLKKRMAMLASHMTYGSLEDFLAMEDQLRREAAG